MLLDIIFIFFYDCMLQIDDEGCFSVELDDLKSGNNNFRYKINGTNYCDSSIPIISLNGETFNTISVFASTTSPIMSLSSKVNIGMTFKVTLVGNWSEEFGNVAVDCKVRIIYQMDHF